jgi:hypothetical protein
MPVMKPEVTGVLLQDGMLQFHGLPLNVGAHRAMPDVLALASVNPNPCSNATPVHNQHVHSHRSDPLVRLEASRCQLTMHAPSVVWKYHVNNLL